MFLILKLKSPKLKFFLLYASIFQLLYVFIRLIGLGVASGTRPSESRVWIKRNDNWSTFQVQEEVSTFKRWVTEVFNIVKKNL